VTCDLIRDVRDERLVTSVIRLVMCVVRLHTVDIRMSDEFIVPNLSLIARHTSLI